MSRQSFSATTLDALTRGLNERGVRRHELAAAALDRVRDQVLLAQ